MVVATRSSSEASRPSATRNPYASDVKDFSRGHGEDRPVGIGGRAKASRLESRLSSQGALINLIFCRSREWALIRHPELSAGRSTARVAQHVAPLAIGDGEVREAVTVEVGHGNVRCRTAAEEAEVDLGLHELAGLVSDTSPRLIDRFAWESRGGNDRKPG